MVCHGNDWDKWRINGAQTICPSNWLIYWCTSLKALILCSWILPEEKIVLYILKYEELSPPRGVHEAHLHHSYIEFVIRGIPSQNPPCRGWKCQIPDSMLTPQSGLNQCFLSIMQISWRTRQVALKQHCLSGWWYAWQTPGGGLNLLIVHTNYIATILDQFWASEWDLNQSGYIWGVWG